MTKFFQRLLHRAYLWSQVWPQKKSEVVRFHGIILADLRRKSPHFQKTLLGALQFIRDHDARRFVRVQRHITWVVNCDLALGTSAEFNSETRTCSIDFQEPEPDDDQTWHVARNARTIVHEATHGALIARGIAYTPQCRVRVEELCVTEENRFLRLVAARARARLQPELAALMESLQRDFDPSHWEPRWAASRWQRALSLLRQVRST